jgi:hypothetical protein
MRDGAEVESPNIPTYYLRGVNYDPEGQRRRTHLELWREFPQLDQCLDLVSQHKLETLEVVITGPVSVVHCGHGPRGLIISAIPWANLK